MFPAGSSFLPGRAFDGGLQNTPLGAPLRRGPGAGEPGAHLWHRRGAAGGLFRAPARGALGGLGHRLRGDSPAVAGAHPGGAHHRGGAAGEGRLAGPALGGGKRLFGHGGHCAGGRPAAWGLFPAGSLDGMACNPPYTAPGAGIPSGDGARRAARQGDSLSLEDLARGARYALRFGGRLCVCLRPQRLAEAVEVFHSLPAGAQAAAAVPAAGGEGALSVFAGVPAGRQAGHDRGAGAAAGGGGRQPHPGDRGHLRRLPGQPGAQKT